MLRAGLCAIFNLGDSGRDSCIPGQEFGKAWGEEMWKDCGDSSDAKRSTDAIFQLTNLRLSKLRPAKYFLGMEVKYLTGVRQACRPCEPHKQSCTDRLFQSPNLQTERRLGDPLLLSCLGEAAITNNRTKNTEAFEVSALCNDTESHVS